MQGGMALELRALHPAPQAAEGERKMLELGGPGVGF